MDDVVLVAVVEGASDLPCKLAGYALAQSTMADDVIEHLASVDILKDHVVVMLMDDHFTHAADVGVVEQQGEGGLAESADFLGGVLGGLFDRGGVDWGRRRAGSREDLDGKLGDDELGRELGEGAGAPFHRTRYGQRA